MYKICYYDNVICRRNPAEPLFGMLRELLRWVDDNDCVLVIKSKSGRITARVRLNEMLKYPYKRTMIMLKVMIKEYFKPSVKDLGYSRYPKDIRDLFKKLCKEGKLIFRFKRCDTSWALVCDTVIVSGAGDILRYLKHPDVLFYCHHRPYITPRHLEAEYFEKGIYELLERRRKCQ